MDLQLFHTKNYVIGKGVELEVRLVGKKGESVTEKVILRAVDRTTLDPIKFQIDGTGEFIEEHSVDIGRGEYFRGCALFDQTKRGVSQVLFRAGFSNEVTYVTSDPVKWVQYKMDIVDTRLTDDIGDYSGLEGVHYINNSSARIKVHYRVLDENNSPLTNRDSLSAFHGEVTSQILFSNGDKLQYTEADGKIVPILQVECVVKGSTDRVLKDVLEEKTSELLIDEDGTVVVSYRVNIFSKHEIMKTHDLLGSEKGGRKFSIELDHSIASAVQIKPVLVLTKYHKPSPKKKVVSPDSHISPLKIELNGNDVDLNDEDNDELIDLLAEMDFDGESKEP